jgi:hypothetical protein
MIDFLYLVDAYFMGVAQERERIPWLLTWAAAVRRCMPVRWFDHKSGEFIPHRICRKVVESRSVRQVGGAGDSR